MQGSGSGPTVSPFLPPPPLSRNPVNTNSVKIDYLSGDAYEAERSSGTSGPTNTTVPTNSADRPIPTQSSTLSPPPSESDDMINPFAAPISTPNEYAPTSKSADQLPPFNHDQKQHSLGKNTLSSTGSGSSYDSLVGQTQNLSIKTPAPSKQGKPEDALFKDLVDFAKSKSSSPKPGSSF